jgi:membrane-bound lytic murein transglycosylase MltF
MKTRYAVAAWVSWGLACTVAAQAPVEKGRLGLALSDVMAPWTGDLDGMVGRRMIRVLTTFSKTQYFVDRGTPRGTAYDQGRLLEDALNAKLGTGSIKVNVQFVPLSRDQLMPALLEGKGDIVMADLTVTPERQAIVDFVDPWIAGVEEIVVTSPNGPRIATVDDLSGTEVFVRQSSSYYQSLTALNERLTREGKAPVKLTPAPEELEDEDLLEMASAGLGGVLVVDNHKAWFWQRVFPSLKLYPTVTLRKGGVRDLPADSGRVHPAAGAEEKGRLEVRPHTDAAHLHVSHTPRIVQQNWHISARIRHRKDHVVLPL